MANITMNANSEQEQRKIEKDLKTLGFKKTHDCMWVKVFVNGKGTEYTVVRNY